MSDDEIILSELSDDELVQQMHDDLYDGLKEEIEEGTNILLGRGWTPYDVLTQALVEGMRIVGEDFRDGILFVPEVLMSANAMKSGMFILRPLLAETGAPKLGKMVIGTVKGDIHDIGKNLVGMMMEGAGFDVIDLGINNPVENYIEAIEREQPDILGMSALLTTTMPYMKVVIDTMKEKGIRDDLHRSGGRRAAQRGVRQGRRRRCLLPRCRRRRGNRQGPDQAPPQPARGRRLSNPPATLRLVHSGCRRLGAYAGMIGRQRRVASMSKQQALKSAKEPRGKVRVIACGMIAREVLAVNAQLGRDHIDLKCVDANFHHHPERIAPGLNAPFCRPAGGL
jgi:methanogenic corrinoid protein MtbC1